MGALEETVTVTGESPIVDVQSAAVQQIGVRMSRCHPQLADRRRSQALIPGMMGAGAHVREAAIQVAS